MTPSGLEIDWTDVPHQWSALLDAVYHGTPVTVIRGGTPVAIIRPLTPVARSVPATEYSRAHTLQTLRHLYGDVTLAAILRLPCASVPALVTAQSLPNYLTRRLIFAERLAQTLFTGGARRPPRTWLTLRHRQLDGYPPIHYLALSHPDAQADRETLVLHLAADWISLSGKAAAIATRPPESLR